MLKQALTYQNTKNDDTFFGLQDILNQSLQTGQVKVHKLKKLQSSDSNEFQNARSSEVTRSTKSKIRWTKRPFGEMTSVNKIQSPEITERYKIHHVKSTQWLKPETKKSRAQTQLCSPYQSIWATNLLKDQFNICKGKKEKFGLEVWIHLVKPKDITNIMDSQIKDSILKRKNYVIANLTFQKLKIHNKSSLSHLPMHLTQHNESRKFLESDNSHHIDRQVNN